MLIVDDMGIAIFIRCEILPQGFLDLLSEVFRTGGVHHPIVFYAADGDRPADAAIGAAVAAFAAEGRVMIRNDVFHCSALFSILR